jgi:SAM-dependent methyltransferase
MDSDKARGGTMTEEKKLCGEWAALAPRWISETRAGRNASRDGLLDERMLAACGDVRGLRVLDLGCGEGRFCRMMMERGGADFALGLDACTLMIEAARELPVEGAEFRVADVQQLDLLEPASFDLAVSYLNQCDLPDFVKNTREVFRVLRPGGRFVVANLHPMRSATGEWMWNNDGTKQHFKLDRYFDEGERHWKMLGVEFTNLHRTLATYINTFLEGGFELEGIEEPTVTDANLQRFPELDDERRVPNFIVYRLRKP